MLLAARFELQYAAGRYQGISPVSAAENAHKESCCDYHTEYRKPQWLRTSTVAPALATSGSCSFTASIVDCDAPILCMMDSKSRLAVKMRLAETLRNLLTAPLSTRHYKQQRSIPVIRMYTRSVTSWGSMRLLFGEPLTGPSTA